MCVSVQCSRSNKVDKPAISIVWQRAGQYAGRVTALDSSSWSGSVSRPFRECGAAASWSNANVVSAHSSAIACRQHGWSGWGTQVGYRYSAQDGKGSILYVVALWGVVLLVCNSYTVAVHFGLLEDGLGFLGSVQSCVVERLLTIFWSVLHFEPNYFTIFLAGW